LSSDGHGGVRINGRLDAEGAAIVSAAACSVVPAGWQRNGSDRRTPSARRADAFVDVCRITMASGGLPDNEGQPAQLKRDC